MNARSAALSLGALVALVAALAAAAAGGPTTPGVADPWPMFRGNPQRTGVASFAGPAHGRVAWNFAAGAPVRSPPAVAKDGTVYFGSDAGRLHAVAADGKERATAVLGGRIWPGPLLAHGRVYVGSDDRYFYALAWRGPALEVVWKKK